MTRFSFLSICLVATLTACNEQGTTTDNTDNEIKKDTISCPPGSSKLDIATIEQITGMKGVEKNGEYKITVPQNDLHVVVDFAMLEDEVGPVIKTLIENGIEVVAVHNHMVHEKPRIFFLHYWGVGPAEKLAKGFKAALDRTGKAVSH